MKLTMIKRPSDKKSAVKEMRRVGNIPAVLYSKGKPNESIGIEGTAFQTALREMKPGRLPTTVFTLTEGKRELKAVVKDIQYHPTTYQVIHMDFEELVPGETVCVKIPIQCTGVVDCVGVKLGGFLRQVIRFVKVECPSHQIPKEFEMDVKELGIRQSKRLRDLAIPQETRILAPLDEVVAVIAKR